MFQGSKRSQRTTFDDLHELEPGPPLVPEDDETRIDIDSPTMAPASPPPFNAKELVSTMVVNVHLM